MGSALVIIFVVLFVSVRPLTTLLHELGHAIPAALFTRSEKIEIFIGSFGDRNNALHFKISRFRFYLKYNPLDWTHGLCRYDQHPGNYFFNYLILLAGPLASLVAAVTLFLIVVYFDLRGMIEFLLIIFTASALLDLWSNLVPSNKPMKLYDGRISYNDGYQLLQTWKLKGVSGDVLKAYDLINAGKPEEAVSIAEKIEAKGVMGKVPEILCYIYLAGQCYDRVIRIAEEAEDNERASSTIYQYKAFACQARKMFPEALLAYNLAEESIKNAYLYCNRGYVFLKLKRYEDALADFERTVQADDKLSEGLNNLGYILCLFERYSEAVTYFDKAIISKDDFAYAYAGRGWARVKLGDKEGSFSDLERSMELDPANSYCFLNFGIYYLEAGDVPKALEYLGKAEELDPDTVLLEETMEEARKKLIVS